MLLISIHLIAFEVSCANAFSEHNVQLLKRPALSLGIAEISSDEEEEASPTPDEGGISAQVPLRWIHAVAFNDSDDDTGNVVSIACKTDRFLAQAR